MTDSDAMKHLLTLCRGALQAGSNYNDAKPKWLQCIAFAEQHSELKPHLVTCLLELAELESLFGNFDEAKQLYTRAQHIIERHLDNDPALASLAYAGLASVADQQGKTVEADSLYRNAIQNFQQSSKPNPIEFGDCLFSYARVLTAQRKLDEALDAFNQAYKLYDATPVNSAHPHWNEDLKAQRLKTIRHDMFQLSSYTSGDERERLSKQVDAMLGVPHIAELLDPEDGIKELHKHGIAIDLNDDFVREEGSEDGSYVDYVQYSTLEWLQIFYEAEARYGRDTAERDGFFTDINKVTATQPTDGREFYEVETHVSNWRVWFLLPPTTYRNLKERRVLQFKD